MKNKRFLLIFGLILIILLITILRSVSKKDDEEILLPTPIEISEVIFEESETGAIFLTPTEDEVKIYDSIREIRDNSPIDMGDFIIDFDYKRYKFVVRTNSKELFWDWMNKNGYVIPESEIVFE